MKIQPLIVLVLLSTCTFCLTDASQSAGKAKTSLQQSHGQDLPKDQDKDAAKASKVSQQQEDLKDSGRDTSDMEIKQPPCRGYACEVSKIFIEKYLSDQFYFLSILVSMLFLCALL